MARTFRIIVSKKVAINKYEGTFLRSIIIVNRNSAANFIPED